ncbi:hypothetical protein Pla123a_05600 [Posidoniimonas polymericola]|uniref:PEP-CTERM protein-sorting domain-containing protein n=1 Tax=Posidoniimonas polymericola TaxID=2528002 RepID=A0A5C5ZGS2_9BACT|nr:choice-of-anchor tandem repeat NxxGxxAF-containing protein [Posidoniimonas polymericola]TWT85753.1 hypothetical protein Pla123a_05600 [Posidoniimonas polymericola]
MMTAFPSCRSAAPMLRPILVAAAACLLASTERAAADAIRTVALSDQIAPGFDEPFDWIIDSGIAINDRGSVVFRGAVGEPRAYGIWREVDGNLSLVASEGDPAPGTPDVFGTFDSSDFVFDRPIINNQDVVLFAGTSRDDTSSRFGLWAQPKVGEATLVAIEDRDLAPPDYQLVSHFRYTANDRGEVAMHAAQDAGPDSALLQGIAIDGLSLLVQESEVLGASGYHVDDIPRSQVWINDNGYGIVSAALEDDGANPHVGLLLTHPGEPAQPLAVQEVAGEIGGAQTSYSYIAGGVNNRNTVVYTDQRFSRDDPSLFQQSLWEWSPSSGAELLARTGEVHEDLGVTFVRISHAVVNGNDQTAFLARTIDGEGQWSAQGLWLESPDGVLTAVVEQGADAPGAAAQFLSVGDGISVNRRGQIAFLGHLQGDGVTSDNSGGIWATDADGQLQLVARHGQTIDVSSDATTPDLRVIDRLYFYTNSNGNSPMSGLEDGRASPFNEAGEIVFDARFTDGTTGVFVSRLVAVPEPSVTLLAGVAALAAAGGGRRRA